MTFVSRAPNSYSIGKVWSNQGIINLYNSLIGPYSCICVSIWICVSVYPSVYGSVYLRVYGSVYLRVFGSVCLRICISACLWIYVSVYICASICRDCGATLRLGATISVSILGGGEGIKHFFLLILYNFKNIGGGGGGTRAPSPPPYSAVPDLSEYLCVQGSVCLRVYGSVYLRVYMPGSVCISACLWIYVCVCLRIYQSKYLCVKGSVCLRVYGSVNR